ncbi:lamin tail domain-containing protein [Paenibacillus sp. Dod16]|uniref:lamin tail domain-containing protein n=1 Tax=Paenibacillus sp. Dod16 TaxID=3416392 RepID=UPI003CEC763E
MRIRLHRRQRPLSMLLAIVMLLSIIVPFSPVKVAEASPRHDQVVISQVYGGGGNSGATYTHDFIELFNPTGSPIDLTGWKVRYASATGNFNNEIPLSGKIEPYAYYLIQQQSNGSVGASLPTADDAGTLNLSGSNGKVDLVNAAGDRIDLIGYGSASEYETSPTAALSNSTAAIRKELTVGQNDRGRDTDNNAADFIVMTPDPRNSASSVTPVTPGSGLGAVTANPEPNAWPAGTEITLNPPTVGASVYADVYLSGGNGSDHP